VICSCEHDNESSGSMKCGDCLHQLNDCCWFLKNSAAGNSQTCKEAVLNLKSDDFYSLSMFHSITVLQTQFIVTPMFLCEGSRGQFKVKQTLPRSYGVSKYE
jgi:hypothetical protein